ncbi:MAG: GDYXXLXY domain-containing protein [Synergistaceae bacterium]|jgi:uncharacterized membrane-anchored protein|nr:GDYXXLXY domain-containing protein [Synergistaceae bacterium]
MRSTIEKLLKSTVARYVAIVALPLLALLYSPILNFTILALGERVLLENVPVDPWDFLRGDYVMLDYKISQIPRALLYSASGGKEDYDYDRPAEVYVELAKNPSDVASVRAVSFTRPTDGLYLKGRLGYSRGESYDCDYGLGVFYIPEGTGHTFENPVQEGRVMADVRVLMGHAVIKNLVIAD